MCDSKQNLNWQQFELIFKNFEAAFGTWYTPFQIRRLPVTMLNNLIIFDHFNWMSDFWLTWLNFEWAFWLYWIRSKF